MTHLHNSGVEASPLSKQNGVIPVKQPAKMEPKLQPAAATIEKPRVARQTAGAAHRKKRFLAFRPASASPTTNPSPPPSPRLHAAPPPLSASFSPSTSVVAPDHVAAAAAASFYDVLGLHAGASAREIKDAYRRLARAVHPDASPHPAAASSDDFIRVHAAYSTLSDPDKRADYDRRLLLLAAGRRRATPSLGRSPTFPARRRRTWETDQCW
ncbi:hypothetical protein OsJ_10115 [Oryza sativa Japonica Group]|uniref:J domain-containing protein n=1 Tax=Oryza sativa subsp. japonica TaxID=39947 RepID=B9F6R1_ORYSJ|nr:hypothetical protein OsJ_10115 [Oryza sativa Japonica Group]